MQEAQRLIQEAHKAAGEGWKGPAVDRDLVHTVEHHQGSISDAIEKANTDNARIYFQRVPNTVPAVQPAVMVNSAPPTGVPLFLFVFGNINVLNVNAAAPQVCPLPLYLFLCYSRHTCH